MLKLGFRNFRPIFLKSTFLVATFFLYLWLSVLVDICVLTLGNKGVKVLAEPFIR